MPFYEYECRSCGGQLETLQKMSDAPLVDCPACHKPALQKKISAAGFRLKGGGWYETDFKSGNKKNIAASQDSASANNGTKPENKSTESSGKGADQPASKPVVSAAD